MTEARDDAIRDRKAELRKTMREAVLAMRPFARARAAERAAARAIRSPALACILARASALGAGRRSATVLLYRSLPDEIDTDPLARLLVARGVTVAYPRVVARRNAVRTGSRDDAPITSLQLVAIDATDPLDPSLWTTDEYGIRAPRPDEGAHGHVRSPLHRIAPRDIDAAVVPGRAFDPKGRRLGRGKGFYDGLLPRLRPDARAATLGYAFATQVADAVPVEPHDAAVAWLATDLRLARCGEPRPSRADDVDDEFAASDAECDRDATT